MRKKDDEKLQSIKRAVIRLILTEGFHGISISKIAREAGVSPATVYVYYSCKEAMLRDIYREYGEQIYSYLLAKIHRDMGGPQLVNTLIQAYYSYIIEYEEEFYFVEQFSSCPALVGSCSRLEGSSRINLLFEDLKTRNVIRNVNNHSIAALMFTPVKRIAIEYYQREEEARPVLSELIQIIQEALLI